MTRIHTALITMALLLVAVPATAQLPQPTPRSPLTHAHGSLQAGWYASSKVYKYIADLNVDFDFGSWKGAIFNFHGGILTLIKSTSESSFQPDRYRGTLEPSVYTKRGASFYSFAIRHQSFHSIDRPPDGRESYELYNLGYWYVGFPNVTITVGRYLHREDVDYQWDFFAEVDTACIGTCRYGLVYVSGVAHYVTESETLSNRSSFFDYELELGIQASSGVRYFMAFRRLHDVDKFNGTTDSQFVIGLKYVW